MTNRKIVIWGADNYNTLGLVRSLANNGFDMLLLINGHKNGVASASKYCTKYHETHTVEDAVRYLIQNYKEENNPLDRAVLMPGGDTYSIGGAENYDLLKNRFHIMCTPDPTELIKVTDKVEMGKTAEKAGLLTPKSQLYTVGTNDINVPFPILLKPIKSEATYRVQDKAC